MIYRTFSLRVMLITVAGLCLVMAFFPVVDRNNRRRELIRDFEGRIDSSKPGRPSLCLELVEENTLTLTNGSRYRILVFDSSRKRCRMSCRFFVAITTIDYRLVDQSSGNEWGECEYRGLVSLMYDDKLFVCPRFWHDGRCERRDHGEKWFQVMATEVYQMLPSTSNRLTAIYLASGGIVDLRESTRQDETWDENWEQLFQPRPTDDVEIDEGVSLGSDPIFQMLRPHR